MAKKNKQTAKTPLIEKRGPVVAIMGHIDHGKSTLLDYIRKANVVGGEAGGITQHISAYEVEHAERMITFLDTPGHAAFAKTRERGASIADIAVLIVSAEDGVKEQTMGAYEFIKESGIPFIVAINKIDSAKADSEKTKYSLVEKGIYLEGMGGDVSYNEISAKTGQGVDDLLDTILLAADLEELEADRNALGTGIVLESSLDPKKGISATLIIKDGTINSGNHIVSGAAQAPVRIMEDYAGSQIKTASFSKPIKIIGFDAQPASGSTFRVFETKKAAQEYIKDGPQEEKAEKVVLDPKKETVPLIIKTDVIGSLEAIKHQIEEMDTSSAVFKIVSEGVGDITENDIRQAGADKKAVVVGFHVGQSRTATDLAETFDIEIKKFDIIYELTDFLSEALETRRTRIESEKVFGEAKIIRVFSWTNKGGVIGGKVKEGVLETGDKVVIVRRDIEIGRGVIKGLQKGKMEATIIQTDEEFGMMISSKYEIAEGDRVRAVRTVSE